MRFDIGIEINLGFIGLAWHPLAVQVEQEDGGWRCIGTDFAFDLFGFTVLASWAELTHDVRPMPWVKKRHWELGITLLNHPRIWGNELCDD